MVDTMERVAVVYQYGQGRFIMQDPTYAEADADSCSVYSEGGYVAAHLVRAPRGKWKIESSDGPLPLTAYRLRFAKVDDVAAYVGKRWKQQLARVDSFVF